MKDLFTLFGLFFKIGIMTFGGGYAMLPMLERELVTKRSYVTLEEIMDYFAIGQCTPGVIAVNVGTFIGHKNRGILGGIVATLGVVTPSVIIISLIATVLNSVYQNPIVKSAFKGIGIAVCAILVQAELKIGKAGIVDKFTALVAVIAFLLSMFLNISTIVVIVAAGIAGIAYKYLHNKNGGAE